MDRSLHEYKNHDKSRIEQEPVPDRTGYGSNWIEQRQKVLDRDDGCRLCEDGDASHVHHIVKKDMFQSAEESNHLSNLVLLCVSCHNRIEGISFVKQVRLLKR